LAEPSHLSAAAISCIAEPEHQIFCSVVNLSEIQIMVKMGKLDQLLVSHKDPCDRLLIAQAVEGNLTLVSVDPLMRDYSVAVLA
jgi:PIN domain nuclease of toxin-antitoxin system